MSGLGWHFTHTQLEACKEVRYIKVNASFLLQTVLDKEVEWLHNYHLNTQPTGGLAVLIPLVDRPTSVFVLHLPREERERGRGVGGAQMGGVGGGVSIKTISIHYSHICTHTHTHRKTTNKKKTSNGDPGKHHNSWHTRDLGVREVQSKYTHMVTVKAGGPWNSGSRGFPSLHIHGESHTSTVHGTRGHLSTRNWRWGR